MADIGSEFSVMAQPNVPVSPRRGNSFYSARVKKVIDVRVCNLVQFLYSVRKFITLALGDF